MGCTFHCPLCHEPMSMNQRSSMRYGLCPVCWVQVKPFAEAYACAITSKLKIELETTEFLLKQSKKQNPCFTHECPNCEGTGKLTTKVITCCCPRCQS